MMQNPKSKEFAAWLDEIKKTHTYCDNYYCHTLPMLKVLEELYRAVEDDMGPTAFEFYGLEELMKPVPP